MPKRSKSVNKIIGLPIDYVPKKERKLRELAIEYNDGGYSWETAVIAAQNQLWIEKLENRIRKLEGHKIIKHSPSKRRKQGDVVSLFIKPRGGNDD